LRLVGESRIYSATDLTNFLACAHLTQLQVQRLGGLIEPPAKRAASTADLAAKRGLDHERRYLEVLRAEYGDDLVSIENNPNPEGLLAAVEETAAAMQAGASVINQAAFLKDSWMGYADFVMRVEEPSDLGDWSYLPLDTKYARSVKPYFAIQLCSYAELIEEIQGTAPGRLDLVLGDNSRHSLRFEEFRSYYRRLKSRFLATMESENGVTYPLPVEHCEVCDWAEPCEDRRVADDHLSLVANLGRTQAIKFEAEGVASRRPCRCRGRPPPAWDVGVDLRAVSLPGRAAGRGAPERRAFPGPARASEPRGGTARLRSAAGAERGRPLLRHRGGPLL